MEQKTFLQPTKFKTVIFIAILLVILIFGSVTSICVKCNPQHMSWRCGGCNPFFGLMPWVFFLPSSIIISYIIAYLISRLVKNTPMENPVNLEKFKPKRKWLLLFVFGLALQIIWQFLLFLIYIVWHMEEPSAFWPGNIIATIYIIIFSYLFSRLMKPETRGRSLQNGLIWAVISAAILLAISIPNDTQSVFFGQWSFYLGYLGIIIGAVLVK